MATSLLMLAPNIGLEATDAVVAAGPCCCCCCVVGRKRCWAEVEESAPAVGPAEGAAGSEEAASNELRRALVPTTAAG